MASRAERIEMLLTTAYDLVAESIAPTRQYDYAARAASLVRDARSALEAAPEDAEKQTDGARADLRAALEEARPETEAPAGGCPDCDAKHPRYAVPSRGEVIHALPGGQVSLCEKPHPTPAATGASEAWAERSVVEAAILWAERRSDDLASAVNLLESVNALLRHRAARPAAPDAAQEQRVESMARLAYRLGWFEARGSHPSAFPDESGPARAIAAHRAGRPA